jgi:hypothetical protein
VNYGTLALCGPVSKYDFPRFVQRESRSQAMTKRVCYIHIGPHKTGTKAIQWFLQEQRTELLNYGYFVPESGNVHGGHHAIARKLCGQEIPDHEQPLAARFGQMIGQRSCETVVISSEALDGLLRNVEYAKSFFKRLRELNLEPKLVAFARNQSQLINSLYAQVVKDFHRSEPFEAFVQTVIHHAIFRYSQLTGLADAFDAELIPRPFNKETIDRGVVREFLLAIGINSSQFQGIETLRNEAVGPFTVGVARDVLRSIAQADRPLKWRQAGRCKRKLAAYLEEKGWTDSRYCGLSTSLARHIEEELRSDNDAFAQSVWGRPWGDIFATDVTEEFTPNDFEIRPPDWFTARRLRRAVRRMKALAREILSNRELAAEAPWNDMAYRSG